MAVGKAGLTNLVTARAEGTRILANELSEDQMVPSWKLRAKRLTGRDVSFRWNGERCAVMGWPVKAPGVGIGSSLAVP